VSIHYAFSGIASGLLDSLLLSSRGMTVLTIMVGLGVYVLSRVFKPRHAPFPKVAPPPRLAVVQNDDGRPRVRGRASSEKLVTSPFTHTPCCYYYAEIEQDLPVFDLFPTPDPSSGGGSWNWSNIHITASSADFDLENASQKVPMSPASLDVRDVPVVFEYQVPETNRSAQDQALVDYVTKNCPDKLKTRFASLAQTALVSEEQAADPIYQQRMQEWRKRRERMFQRRTKGQRFRFRERCILPGGEYAIAGIAQQGSKGEQVSSRNA
jgi:hypothetical protein